MRVSARVFLSAVVTLLLFSGLTASTPSQASSNALQQATPAACWSVVSSPTPSTILNMLYGVAALTSSDLWAVGSFDTIIGTGTLTEHWDGTSWNVVSSPNVGTISNKLNAVSAISPNDVWAVGFYEDGNFNYGTLIEHWNGISWNVVPSPSPNTYRNELNGVAAVSRNNIWAVGFSQDDNNNHSTLVEHWNGTNWSVISSPTIDNLDSLNGVAAVSSSDVWAVGATYSGTVETTLAEHWNGTSWSIVTSPDPGTYRNGLDAVTAISSSNIWVVGSTGSGNGVNTMIEHWDGTSWSVVASPNLSTFDNELVAVTAISPSDIWAVGFYYNSGNGPAQTLVEHWDGSSWSIVPSSNPSTSYSILQGVAAISPSDVWAVGYYYSSGIYYTLIEHYSTSGCGTPTPTTTDTPAPTNTPGPTDTPQPTVCPNPFVDIYNNIFFHAINALYCRGDINGTDSTHYTPSSTSTRGQFAKVVVLGFGLPMYTPTGGQDFSDVPPAYFAYGYIESGYHAGILSGFDANTCTAYGVAFPCYLPNLPITRGQLTKLVVNAAGYPLYTPTSGQTFSDVPPSNVFFAAIETAHNKGVINGYPDNTFRPNNNIRRDEMAQIVYKGVTTP